ncbi:MAG: hypothetical protein J1G06_05405 [Oscillospiraceae bacterium]|nr:hypothetical protein [Oscillospiraceae bacterium]
MDAIHSTWSKPRIYSTGGFFIEDFDILTTILSALKWREKNGRIKMVTDSTGLEFYKSRGMCDIWDEITTELDDIPDTVNPEMFWAAGKVFALKNQTAPVAAIDTDFIVWDRLAFDNMGDISVIHKEDIYTDVYPDIYHFNMKQGYIFDPGLDWRENPSNMAFYVIRNEALKNSYTDAAIEFMENSLDGDNLTYMVFAEQRLISMIAKKSNIEINAISTPEKLFKDGERYFTHTWGMKQQMRDMPELRADFCRRCIGRIKRDFPDYSRMTENIAELAKYL